MKLVIVKTSETMNALKKAWLVWQVFYRTHENVILIAVFLLMLAANIFFLGGALYF